MGNYQEAKNAYLKEKVDEFKVRVPKGEKKFIQEFAKERGKSLNTFVLEAIREKMDREADI